MLPPRLQGIDKLFPSIPKARLMLKIPEIGPSPRRHPRQSLGDYPEASIHERPNDKQSDRCPVWIAKGGMGINLALHQNQQESAEHGRCKADTPSPNLPYPVSIGLVFTANDLVQFSH